jgi:hypothetical protein
MRPQADKHNSRKDRDLCQETARLSHHLPTDVCHTDSDLAVIVASWSQLPAVVRAGIVAMVKAAVETKQPE